MPTRKQSSRKTGKGSQSKSKTKTKKGASSRPSRKPLAPRRLSKAKKMGDDTFVYECTRTDCGYKIWRDDKGEAGEVRFDLKCPKCHNRTFKCLGKEEIPESFNAAETALNLDNIQPEALGSS